MRSTLSALTLLLAVGTWALSQDSGGNLFELGESLGEAKSKKVDVTAVLTDGGQPGTVNVQIQVVLPPGANTYSQDPGFAKPTKIAVTAPGWSPLGKGFAPDHPPKQGYDELFDQEVGKFTGTVVFSRRYLAPMGIDPQSVKLPGKIEMLICDENTCEPQEVSFIAAYSETGLAGSEAAPIELESFPSLFDPETIGTRRQGDGSQMRPGNGTSTGFTSGYAVIPTREEGTTLTDPAELQFELSSLEAPVGEKVTVAVTLTLADNWTTYGLKPADDTQLEVPTRIQLQPTGLSPQGELIAVPPPKVHELDLGGEIVRSAAHEGRVTWKQEFMVTEAGAYGVQGSITYQICEKGQSCMPPRRVPFSLGTVQRTEDLAGAFPITNSFVGVQPTSVADAAQTPSGRADLFQVHDEGAITSLSWALPAAFLAGLILNVMPCVLPVLAIKILSFVQQAGESRQRILALNLAYTAGVVTIFLGLAVLATAFQIGWGGQFQDDRFIIGLIFVVFAMGLSLLGVFELPVPGLIPSANDHTEGLWGAFNTGIVATMLATPCSGPFMAPVFAFTLSQPKPVIFLIFAVMGLGMASPYLIAGLFPAFANLLPRPGMWMVRFKQFSGFVLMGTVLWLLESVEANRQLPVLVMLLAIALALWMVGNLYDLTSTTSRKWKVRLTALAVAAPIFWYGFSNYQFLGTVAPPVAADEKRPDAIVDHAELIAWSPFSEERLLSLREEGKPMIIDFTADWCAVCKTNEKLALNTTAVADFLRQHEIVPLMADFTKRNPEIRKWLNQFGQDMVPLTVIIPPGKASKVIAIRGGYTQSTLLAKLAQAVSADETTPAAPAQEEPNVSATDGGRRS